MLSNTLSRASTLRPVHSSLAPCSAKRRPHLHRQPLRRTQLVCASQDDQRTSSPSVTNSPAEEEEIVGLGLGPMKEKSTLISDNWVGDQYQGSGLNILTLILGLTFAVPVIGLAFAYFSYGNLWTGQWGVIPY